MYSNKCTKCGVEFETKNPNRVICPTCLYPEASATPSQQRPQYGQRGPGGPPGGGYQQRGPGGPGGGYPPRGPGGPGYPPRGPGGPGGPGGYPPRGPGGPGGFQQRGPGGPGGPGRGFGPPRRGPGGPPRRGPAGPRKKLLVSKEQLIEIEKLYRAALPLPNPDIHEVIGLKIDLSPSKVFFGINLIREKMKLPKIEYPKRRLAVSPEQLIAIETLYESFLPLPPVGVHKIISRQLKIDEWRVHVGIGLVRKNRNMPRWNEERDDLPAEMKVPKGKKPHPNAEPKPDAAKPEAKEGEPADKPAEAADATPPKEEAAPKPEKKTRPKAEKAPAAEKPAEDASSDEKASVPLPVKEPDPAPEVEAKEA